MIGAMPRIYHHVSSHRLLSDAAADNVARWQRYDHYGCDFRMEVMLMPSMLLVNFRDIMSDVSRAEKSSWHA